MKFIIVTLALICAAYAQTDADWVNFQKQFGKVYRNVDEVADRRAKWEKNFRLIQKHNAEFEQGLHTYTLGENPFADMSYEEFAQQRLTFKPFEIPTTEVHQIDAARQFRSFHDLRDDKVVSPVKDQGQCGGCWAFTCVAAVEILYTQKYNKTETFSEQQLIDCNKGFLIFGNQGCNGGTFTPTFDYIKTNGLQTDASYPYVAKDGTCKFSSSAVVSGTKVTGYVAITTEKLLVDAVAAKYPVAIGVFASDKFMLYKNGVYVGNATENSANPNHAILVVGYNLLSPNISQQYYIVKNSWSDKWGDKGYVHLGYGVNNLNILKMPVYPKL